MNIVESLIQAATLAFGITVGSLLATEIITRRMEKRIKKLISKTNLTQIQQALTQAAHNTNCNAEILAQLPKLLTKKVEEERRNGR